MSSRPTDPFPFPADRVRIAWERDSTSDLVAILGSDPDLSAGRVIDALVEDTHQRLDRGLPAGLPIVRAAFPHASPGAELVRALLMTEASHRAAEGHESVRTDLLARHPEHAAEIEVVVAMLALMSEGNEGTPPPLAPGLEMGRYRLVEHLGSGSFGDVWCTWDATLERYVALKLLPAASAAGGTLDAVIREAKAAAAIDHENVVKVHDAGATEDAGRCYIDTQLVGDPAPTPDDPKRVRVGRALSAVLAEHPAGLPWRDAAAHVLAVARGTAAAHARGIVHRDIKPSNIIVTPSGRPMLSDFGLSILNEGIDGPTDLRAAETRSISARVTGTPAFMSPEQARGEHATPASDIYALGVTLWALLSGKMPFAPAADHPRGPSWSVVEQVRTTPCPPILPERPTLPRDLAAVCDRATAFDPARRYLSAQALADDLAALLSGRPVTARPPGPARAAWMWSRRHRAWVITGVGILTLASLGLWRYVVNINLERDRAVAAEKATARQLAETERARAAAHAVNDFLQGMLGAADPQLLGKDAKVLDAVRLAAGQIEGRFKTEPLIESDVRESLGWVYNALGLTDQTIEQWRRTLELRRAELGEDAPRTIQMRHALAIALWNVSNAPEAVPEVEAATAHARRVLPVSDPVRIGVEMDYSTFLGGNHRFADAYALLKGVLGEIQKRGETDTEHGMTALRLFAGAAGYMGNVEEGVTALTRLLDAQEASLGKDSFQRFHTMIELAGVLQFAGRAAESADWYRKAHEGLSRMLSPGSAAAFSAALNAATLDAATKDGAQRAIDTLAPALEAYAATPEYEPMLGDTARRVLGVCHFQLGDYARAEPLLLAGREAYIGRDGRHEDTLRRIDRRLVDLYEAWGKPEEAAQYRR